MEVFIESFIESGTDFIELILRNLSSIIKSRCANEVIPMDNKVIKLPIKNAPTGTYASYEYLVRATIESENKNCRFIKYDLSNSNDTFSRANRRVKEILRILKQY